MNDETIDNLTAAEAGFLYGVIGTGGDGPGDWTVDELAARPLAKVLEPTEINEESGAPTRLEDGRLSRWRTRTTPTQPESFRQKIERAFGWLEAGGVPDEICRRQMRRVIGRTVGVAGRDLSRLSPDVLDMRWWFESGGDRVIGLRLVVLGAVLVGSLDRMVVRRRMAAMMKQLPSSVRQEVQQGLAAVQRLEPAVARRIYEVWARFAEREYRTDEELALIGLFFVVSASVFRQNGVLERLQRALSERLSRRCRKYRRACLRSDKPELSPEIAETIQPAVAPEVEEDGIDETESQGRSDE